MVTGSIPGWVTDLGKENAKAPGSIPGAPNDGFESDLNPGPMDVI